MTDGRAATRPPLQSETACAVCGGRDYRAVAHVDRNGRPLRTVMCNACGLVWTNPRPSDQDVDRYYSHEYRVDYTRRREPTPRKVLRGMFGADERRRALGALLRPGRRVLDVGCGAGEFVYLLRRDGVEASGIEPGEEYAEFSRRTLEIPIETATVESAVIAPGSIDVVTMFHVLEHAADPRRVLATVAGWVSSGGALAVEVPNVDSIVQAPRHRFHYAHLYNFSAATLAALGEAVGFRLLDRFESDDGGNITCVFRRGQDEPRVVTGLPENVARTMGILTGHTSLRHYLTATPYRRVLVRLARRWREDRLLRGLPTVEAVVRWAAGPSNLGRLARNANSRLH